jgi:hypothetical protein
MGNPAAEHEQVVAEFIALVERVPAARWQQPMAPGKWSPATLTVHVTRAYEFGREAVRGKSAMRLRVSPVMAWLSGRILFPILIALRRFPTGVKAPREVRPDEELAATLSPAEAIQRLRATSDAALAEISRPEAANARITHAYFGSLSPRQGIRLLSGHTRHHARQLRAALEANAQARS